VSFERCHELKDTVAYHDLSKVVEKFCEKIQVVFRYMEIDLMCDIQETEIIAYENSQPFQCKLIFVMTAGEIKGVQ
jgi:hypothetical protein